MFDNSMIRREFRNDFTWTICFFLSPAIGKQIGQSLKRGGLDQCSIAEMPWERLQVYGVRDSVGLISRISDSGFISEETGMLSWK